MSLDILPALKDREDVNEHSGKIRPIQPVKEWIAQEPANPVARALLQRPAVEVGID